MKDKAVEDTGKKIFEMMGNRIEVGWGKREESGRYKVGAI